MYFIFAPSTGCLGDALRDGSRCLFTTMVGAEGLGCNLATRDPRRRTRCGVDPLANTIETLPGTSRRITTVGLPQESIWPRVVDLSVLLEKGERQRTIEITHHSFVHKGRLIVSFMRIGNTLATASVRGRTK